MFFAVCSLFPGNGETTTNTTPCPDAGKFFKTKTTLYNNKHKTFPNLSQLFCLKEEGFLRRAFFAKFKFRRSIFRALPIFSTEKENWLEPTRAAGPSNSRSMKASGWLICTLLWNISLSFSGEISSSWATNYWLAVC